MTFPSSLQPRTQPAMAANFAAGAKAMLTAPKAAPRITLTEFFKAKNTQLRDAKELAEEEKKRVLVPPRTDFGIAASLTLPPLDQLPGGKLGRPAAAPRRVVNYSASDTNDSDGDSGASDAEQETATTKKRGAFVHHA